MISVQKMKDKVIIEKDNKKYILKSFISKEIYMVFISLVFILFIGKKNAIYCFLFLTSIMLVSHLSTIFSYYANEKLEITKEYIVIRFYAWKLPIYKAVLKNDENLKISYDEKMKGSIKFIFKLNYSIFYPRIYRLMKFEANGFKYSFGYDLERSDYQKIKDLILEQRNRISE